MIGRMTSAITITVMESLSNLDITSRSSEDGHSYKHKGVDLKNIYKNVLLAIAELARENFEKEGFKVKIRPNEQSKRYETYVVEVSW